MKILCASSDDLSIAPLMKFVLHEKLPDAEIHLASLIPGSKNNTVHPHAAELLKDNLQVEIEEYKSKWIKLFNLTEFDVIFCATSHDYSWIEDYGNRRNIDIPEIVTLNVTIPSNSSLAVYQTKIYIMRFYIENYFTTKTIR